MSTNLEAALYYAQRLGWRVFPLKPGDKRPAVIDWPNVATTDPEQIRRWWAQMPAANIGLACGDLLAVDLDRKDGRGVRVPAVQPVAPSDVGQRAVDASAVGVSAQAVGIAADPVAGEQVERLRGIDTHAHAPHELEGPAMQLLDGLFTQDAERPARKDIPGHS